MASVPVAVPRALPPTSGDVGPLLPYAIGRGGLSRPLSASGTTFLHPFHTIRFGSPLTVLTDQVETDSARRRTCHRLIDDYVKGIADGDAVFLVSWDKCLQTAVRERHLSNTPSRIYYPITAHKYPITGFEHKRT